MDNDFATGYALGADSNNNGNGCNNGGMWGGDWIWAFLIFALFGWGNGGFGGGFGGNGGGYVAASATQADIQRGFDTSNIISKLDGITQGLCDGFYAMNNSIMSGFNSTNVAMLQGFHGVDNAVCTLGYQTQAGFNALGSQLASCCCETQRQIERGFCDTNYNLATNTTAIIQNAHNDTDRVIAKLDAMEMSRKDETIASLRGQVEALNLAQSQANQNAFFDAALTSAVAQLRTPQPVPAYTVPAPYPYCVPNGSYHNGCGCNSGCGTCC